MIEIDGSQGEGGGQVLRSALTLSILTRQEFRLTQIRARRPKPGLQPQHLAAVRAAASICSAEVEGDQTGSQTLRFHPGEVRSGRYRFEIGTAGSTSLVLQTIFLPLALGKAVSTVTIRGGTHVPWAPCFHYIERQWLPHLQTCGLRARVTLNAAGFYPQGGGEIQAAIRPAASIAPLTRLERGGLLRIRGISGVANLEMDIARRQKLQALRRLEPLCRDTKIELIDLLSPVKGTFILLAAEFAGGQICTSALGAPGKRAERVADEAVEALVSGLESGGTLDEHLADQLLVPLALAEAPSAFRTTRVTGHLLTNAAIVRAFLPARIRIEGELNQPALVSITP